MITSTDIQGSDVEFLGNSDMVTFMGPGPLDTVKESFEAHKTAWIVGGLALIGGLVFWKTRS